MQENIIIYLGPSLQISEAKCILRADYRPPVRRIDLIEILHVMPDTVGIIDGVFFEESAVGHREILEVLKAGIRVIGASSMGALRAAELEPFGMIGIGEIFRMYRDGIIEADDEVALMCDPITNCACSEAMVNVRITCQRGVLSRIISQIEADEIIDACKKLWYPDRTWIRILKDGISDELRRNELSEWFLSHRIDQKRKDAIEALSFIKEQTS